MIEIVKFGSPTCAPCHQVDELLDQIEVLLDHVTVTRIDATKEPEKVAERSVKAVPTVFLHGRRYVGGPSCVGRLTQLLNANLLR